MPDGSVAFQSPSEASPSDRLAAALSRGGALRAGPAEEVADGDWFLFETPEGRAAFRFESVGGLAVPAPEEADGAGGAAQVAAAERALLAIEDAIGVAIVPKAIGPAPEAGLRAKAEHEDAVVLLCLPEALARGFAPADAPGGTLPHRVRMPAPALAATDIPGPGDLLVLGTERPCEVAPLRPHGANAFAATVGTGAAAVAATAADAGAVVTFEALLTPGQAASLRAGSMLVVGEGEAPVGTYAADETTRTGRLVPLGAAMAFRFD